MRRIEKGVDSGRQRAATAVTQHYEKSNRGQARQCIIDAANHRFSQHIACHPQHEKFVCTLAEYQFDRHPRISASKHQRERLLYRKTVIIESQFGYRERDRAWRRDAVRLVSDMRKACIATLQCFLRRGRS